LRVLPLLAGLFALACREAPDEGGAPVSPFPPGAELETDFDQPIRLSYVCGNRFLVTNAHTVPVSVQYRVRGSSEEGHVDLAAAPNEDPAFSEAMLEVRSRGVVELFVDGRPLRARANEGVPCSPATPAPSLLSAAGPEESGEWTAPFDWPIVAVHLMLLPSGKVLSWGHYGAPQLWDPASGLFSEVPSPVLLFCAGQALTADGRLLAAGGHISDDHGLPDITIFEPAGTWSQSVKMMRGRWYPTTTAGPNGEMVIVAGQDEAGTLVALPEVWFNGTIRTLTTASKSIAYYPRMFLAPNGKYFVAGEDWRSRYLSIAGTGAWSGNYPRRFVNRTYGSAVMYDYGKILYAGGGYVTNTAEVIDLTKSPPAWQWTGSMAYPRRNLNLTVLPTGEVLATGGTGGTTTSDLTQAAHAAELWSPSTGQWTTLASNVVSRGYHATSILLPDGRVLHSGSGDAANQVDERNAEIFSPPYLFRGARPMISAAPPELHYGISAKVSTPDPAAIARVTLIRLGAATHAFDMGQRFQRLSFTRLATQVKVTIPTNRNRTPPGHYMLFLLNSLQVPSVGAIVQVK
jgi:hypothetical protein